MSETLLINALEVMNKFMTKKGWQRHSCKTCGKIFFSKISSKTDVRTCGWRECDNKTYLFRTFTKQKKMLTPAQTNTIIKNYFNSVSFKPIKPLNIANFKGNTDLTIAGVQIFDNIIHHNQQTREDNIFVAQPCIRTQFQKHIESQEGTSTSFVNVCTEKMGAKINQHLQTIDHWCTALSKLGLHMNNFIIVMRMSLKDWGTGQFSALELFFSYGGLELGDATYMIIPQTKRPPIPISDIGFGLERITWAINKNISYFDTLTPWSLEGSKEMFDCCRTLTLLALCGVKATSKGPGLQFRRFAKIFSEKYYGANIHCITKYYFDYWSKFIKPSVSQDIAIQFICKEIERFINLKISKMLKLPPPRNETTEDYFNRLVYTFNTNIYELRKAIQICKKK